MALTRPTTPTNGDGLVAEFGGTRLLVSDVRTAFLLLNYARHQAVQRAFGLSPDQDNALTFVLAVMAANALRGTTRRVLAVEPSPTTADWLFGGGSLRELLTSVAGPSARQTPQLATLLTIAVVAGNARPAIAKLLHEVRTTSHEIGTATHSATVRFHHRYGYLVDPGHWRERRARRRDSRESSGGDPGPRDSRESSGGDARPQAP